MPSKRQRTFNHVINIPDTVIKASDGEYILTRSKNGEPVELKRKLENGDFEVVGERTKQTKRFTLLDVLKSVRIEHVALVAIVAKGALFLYQKYLKKREENEEAVEEFGEELTDIESFINENGDILGFSDEEYLSDLSESRHVSISTSRFGALLPDGTFRPASGVVPRGPVPREPRRISALSTASVLDSLGQIQEAQEEEEHAL